MGRQMRFYLLEAEKIMEIAQAISDEGFEQIKTVYLPKRDFSSPSYYYETFPFKAPKLFDSIAQPTGLFRFCKAEYGGYRRLEDPKIEWKQAGVNDYGKTIPHSRLYMCTSYFSEYSAEVIEQLNKDYKSLCRTISKIVPMRTVTVNGVSLRLRLDNSVIDYLQKGSVLH